MVLISLNRVIPVLRGFVGLRLGFCGGGGGGGGRVVVDGFWVFSPPSVDI